jgi:ComF family protein
MGVATVSPAFLIKRFSLGLLEFFLPRLCVFCGGVVEQEAEAAVCPACKGQIAWVASPLCPCCGKVFGSREGPDHLCGPCQTAPPPYHRARAAALYEGPVATAITRFKFGRRLDCLPVLQSWLKRPPCREMVAEADLVVPVPLHPRRLKARGFNQALLLAQAFPEATLGREVLVRLRHTIPQVGLNPKERRDNVRGAFAVAHPELVKDKTVLLLDDLYTTGATAQECARVLRRAGAREVNVLTVARVRYD